MNRIASIVATLALLALSASPAHAAETKDISSAAQVHKGQGTVNRIDEKANKVNLTHGPIATLKWPGMTMDFQVKDTAVLKGVAPGQNVEFEITQTGPTQFIITRIAPAATKK
jgi:Cu(I)/Ag(I) efflux system membrane fusion protein